jgi:hypothetical protein
VELVAFVLQLSATIMSRPPPKHVPHTILETHQIASLGFFFGLHRKFPRRDVVRTFFSVKKRKFF